jgi:hypothetical protein
MSPTVYYCCLLRDMANPPSSGAVADGWHISGWWEVATSTGVWTVAVGSYGWLARRGRADHHDHGYDDDRERPIGITHGKVVVCRYLATTR